MALNIGTINGGLKTSQTIEEVDFSGFDSPIDMIKNPNAMRILVYGYRSSGKTHFACSAPSPVIVLDSENRVGIIVGKFSEIDGKQKRIYSKQWRNFEQLDKATDMAIKTLTNNKKKTGETGTIVIDSVSRVWDEIHNDYIKKKYGENAIRSEVKLDPMNDYKELNEIHNKWLQKLLDSGINIILTATAKGDYTEDRYNPSGVKPEGHKHLPHAVDYVIHNYQKEDTIYSQIQKNSQILAELDEIKLMDYPKFEKIIEKLKKRANIRNYEDIENEISGSINTISNEEKEE